MRIFIWLLLIKNTLLLATLSITFFLILTDVWNPWKMKGENLLFPKMGFEISILIIWVLALPATFLTFYTYKSFDDM
jgi:hypothetical protein